MSQIGSKPEKSGASITWRGIVIIVILALIGIFVAINLDTVPINLYGWQLTLPVGLLVVVVFVLGVFMGGMVRGIARKLRKPKPEPGNK